MLGVFSAADAMAEHIVSAKILIFFISIAFWFKMARILMVLRTIINTIVKKILFLLIFVIMTACQQDKNLTIKRQLFVFGTVVDVVMWTVDETAAQQALADISTQFNQMHMQWHAWKPGRLQEINQQLRQGRSVDLSPEEQHVLKTSLDLSASSKGHFNPLIGEIINLWGFHSDEYPLTTPPPTEEVIARLFNNAVGFEDIHWQGHQISSSNPHVWFDLGGVAKGHAVDLAIDIIKHHGIHHAIVNAGGDLRTLGQKGEKPWQIAIQSPKDWQALAVLEANNNEAIFTSGNYRRYKAFNGKRYAHIIDPHTYQPVSQIVSATVIAHDGMLADAAATALVVAGKDWAKIANGMGIKEALVVDEHDRCFATQAMHKRLSQQTITCERPKDLTGGL